MSRFGDLEAEIMDVMWSTPDRRLVRDVWSELAQRRDLAYTTVQTVMDILHRKGWLSREKQGRAYAYWPTRSREDYAAALLGQALETSGDKTGALLRLIERMDADDVAELRNALNALRAGEGRR